MTLRGSVPDFPLDAVLRFLTLSGRTGVLQVKGDRSSGTVGLDSGRLVSASCSEDVDDGDGALGALFAIPVAEFEFKVGDLLGPQSISGELEEILTRAGDERDRVTRIREVVPHDRLVFRLSDRAAARTTIELTSDEWRTLLAVNGTRDVAGIAAALHVRSRVALGLLGALVRAGAVDTDEPSPSALPPVARSTGAVPSSPAAPQKATETTEEWSTVPPSPSPANSKEEWAAPAPEPWSAPAAEPWSAPLSAPASSSEWSAPEAVDAPPDRADDRLAALSGLFATPSAPAPVEPIPSGIVPPPVTPPAAAVTQDPPRVTAPVPPPPKKSGGFFGFGGKSEPATRAVTITSTGAAATRAGKLAAFSNALIAEYNSGRYGKGRVEGKMTNLLLRVDEQADPVDRPIPIEGEILSVSGIDAGVLPEAQAVPYLAFLVTQIHADAEREFGKDKAKLGYEATRRQILGNDPVLGSTDLLGRLPTF